MMGLYKVSGTGTITVIASALSVFTTLLKLEGKLEDKSAGKSNADEYNERPFHAAGGIKLQGL